MKKMTMLFFIAVFLLFAPVFHVPVFYATAIAAEQPTTGGGGGGSSTDVVSYFEPYIIYEVGSPKPETVAIGDINGDGRNDVAMTVGYSYGNADNFKIFVYLQDENGGLAEPVKMDSSCQSASRPTSIDIGDINNGGFNEIIVTCFRDNITVFSVDPYDFSPENYMHWSYSTAESYMTELADLYDNGVNEMIAAGHGTNTATIFAQELLGDVIHPPYEIFNPTVFSVDHNGREDLAVGDVDNNGLKDVVVMSGQGFGYNFGILHQQVDGWSDPVYYGEVNSGDDLSHGIAVGDINGDGKDDVMATRGGNKPYSFIDVYIQDDAGGLLPATTYPSYDLPYAVQVSQVDYNGRNDLIVLHQGWMAVGVYLQDENGELLSEELYTIPMAQNSNPKAMAVGDINGDGLDDVVVAADTGLAILYHSLRVPDISGCIEVDNGSVDSVMLWQQESKQVAKMDQNGCYEFYDTVSGKFAVILMGEIN